MISTIQLNDKVKIALDRMKDNTRQTYEEVIVNMMRELEEQKMKQRDLMIKGCKVMAEDSLRIVKEWENTDSTLDWEWNED